MNPIIEQIAQQLQAVYPADEARALAWWVVEETTGLTRTQLLTECKGTTFSRHMQEVVTRLLQKEPIQYIFGRTFWCGLDLKLNFSTLIPRPETAELVESINHHFEIRDHHSPICVLDIGTGSGCIALALKKAHPDWQITGIDISKEAIDVARENAIRNHLDVTFLQADILSDEIPFSSFSIVVSNPPYICERERAKMDTNVLDYEPGRALFVPDSDPLLFYRRIASLRLAEWLFFEINPLYANQLREMLDAMDYKDITIQKDAYNQDRILYGRITR